MPGEWGSVITRVLRASSRILVLQIVAQEIKNLCCCEIYRVKCLKLLSQVIVEICFIILSFKCAFKTLK